MNGAILLVGALVGALVGLVLAISYKHTKPEHRAHWVFAVLAFDLIVIAAITFIILNHL